LTSIVVVLEPESEPLLDDEATLPTDETRPGVVLLSGSVIVTGSPTLTSACWAASSLIATSCRIELTMSTGPACTVCPTVGVMLVTRTGPGLNTTEPSCSTPVCERPWAASSLTIACAVADVKASPASPLP
jgi:hypothetical protein